MDGVGIIYSFRARLLIVLAALLVSTLAVQYYLNQRAARRRSDRVTAQERALAAGTALALKSISSTKYLGDLDQERGVPLLEEYKDRVLNVLVVNGEGRVDDSLDPRYRPTKLDDGSDHYFRVSEVALPKLVPGQAADELGHFLTSRPPHSEPIPGEPRAVPIALKTSEGNNYIVVVLGSSTWLGGGPRLTPIARRLLPTLALMLSAILVSAILVWGFTRPVDALAAAATRIASGDLDFSVPVAARRDEMGELASTFNGMIADLRRAREVEARLAQAERSAVVGRLASAIAHEIRNPLNYINLSLDHLRTSLAPSDPRKRAVVEKLTAQLKAEVQRINARISEFLTYSRPAELEMRALDLRAEVADALRIVEPQAAESGIEVRFFEEGEVPAVMGDRESLRSAFTNLMINALQSMGGKAGGRLTVALTSVDGRARVRVSDTGVGIPRESVEEIFEPYYSTKETGTGLGLAIVKKAVEDHGGGITVDSNEGEGATFTITLPAEGHDRVER